jgi:hypothetical protein
MHHAAVQGVAHAVDDEGIENKTRIRRHIRNRMPPFFDKRESHRAVPVKMTPREPGHTQDTRTHGRTKALGPHRRTSQPFKPTNNTQPERQRLSATTPDDRSRQAAADRRPNTQQATATGPEPTAPAANSEEAASSEPDPRPCLHPLMSLSVEGL